MDPRVSRVLLAIAIIALFLVPLGLTASTGTAQAFDYSKLKPIQKRILSGYGDLEINRGAQTRRAALARTAFTRSSASPCPVNLDSNVRVNQDCLNIADANLQGRAQAQNETAIAADPHNPNHLVAFYNNYVQGDGKCIGAYSLDRGLTWKTSIAPTDFTNGRGFGGFLRQYWQSNGDPSVAWDTKGNAYLSCQMFNRGSAVSPSPDGSSAVYVYRSTATNGGSWNFPGRPVVENNDPTGTSGIFVDKPYMTVDNHDGSPYQDRVYVTYTEFAADGSAYIWESHSSDYGQTFSPRTLVTMTSLLCVNTYGIATANGTCNENQYSQPFTGPDGALYVAFANFNNAEANANDNHYQMMVAKSTDGGASFGAPVLVGAWFDLPDCATYQNGRDPGRPCVPEKQPTSSSIFRATNYPSAAVNPRDPRQIVVTYGSYISRSSNESNGCVPTGFSPIFGTSLYQGVKTPGACNNSIVVSVSQDGGATFTGGSTDVRQLPLVTGDSGQLVTDQFFQWAAFGTDGGLVVSYYDRQYGDDELNGYSDVSLSSSSDLSHFESQRVTSSSMPPPTQFDGVFFGDYSGLAATTTAHPAWMDSRMDDLFLCPNTGATGAPPQLCTGAGSNFAVANDQNVFTRMMPILSTYRGRVDVRGNGQGRSQPVGQSQTDGSGAG